MTTLGHTSNASFNRNHPQDSALLQLRNFLSAYYRKKKAFEKGSKGAGSQNRIGVWLLRDAL